MYVPKHFAVEDPDELYRFMNAHAFAVLVTTVDGAPFATHLPLLVERQAGGTILRGHVARANPQHRSFGAGLALAMFAGPHAYVSPSLYHGAENVPTWNYAAVHAYGTPSVLGDPEAMRTILARSVEREESSRPEPWEMERLSDAYVERMMGGIVAFEMPVERLEGKYKISQNRAPDERERVRDAFARESDPAARELAALMRREV